MMNSTTTTNPLIMKRRFVWLGHCFGWFILLRVVLMHCSFCVVVVHGQQLQHSQEAMMSTAATTTTTENHNNNNNNNNNMLFSKQQKQLRGAGSFSNTNVSKTDHDPSSYPAAAAAAALEAVEEKDEEDQEEEAQDEEEEEQEEEEHEEEEDQEEEDQEEEDQEEGEQEEDEQEEQDKDEIDNEEEEEDDVMDSNLDFPSTHTSTTVDDNDNDDSSDWYLPNVKMTTIHAWTTQRNHRRRHERRQRRRFLQLQQQEQQQEEDFDEDYQGDMDNYYDEDHHHEQQKHRILFQVNSSSSSSSIRKTATTTTRRTFPRKINARTIPKYVTELFIPPVLHDDRGRNVSTFAISLRQFRQQVLPKKNKQGKAYPKTLLWGYGDPSKPSSFHHPAGTVEVTLNRKTYITWLNELVVNPDACRKNGYKSPPNTIACHYVKHVLQDRSGIPVIDTSLHWAAPNRRCASYLKKNTTDCYGPNTPATNPYYGPVPMVTHVHGAHVETRSDGYPEAWWLPRARNIPRGYATQGRYFKSRFVPSKNFPDDGKRFVNNPSGADKYFLPATQQARGKGYAVFRYTNDHPETTTLWYHDHTLGITRLNVYAAGAGFWNIRTAKDGDSRLALRDAKKRKQRLPGPAAKIGQNPNVFKSAVRRNIREVGLAIKDLDLYTTGRLFYPANRVNFDYPQCQDGTIFGSKGNTGLSFSPDTDVSPIWNPEAFFSIMTVNGNTWPKFTVAPERYRFKLLNACDSRTINLALRIGSPRNTKARQLPFYVIGSDQGMLPQVVQLRSGYATKLVPGKSTKSTVKQRKTRFRRSAMLMGPSERYDVIVDFSGLKHGTAVYMVNTGPDEPFGGFGGDDGGEEDYEPADINTTGQVMKFIVNRNFRKRGGDKSTSPYNLVIKKDARMTAKKKIAVVRDLSVFEYETTKVCVRSPSEGGSNACRIPRVACNQGDIDPLTGISSLTYGPIHANLGLSGRFGPGKLISQRWSDPIRQNPQLGVTEIWEFWNWTGDAHPLHVHLVHFRVLGRYNMKGRKLSGPMPYEMGRKDTVVALPGQVTRVQLTFDMAGLYVWHCHILSHEDNAMMLPYCVGRRGIDCPASFFSK